MYNMWLMNHEQHFIFSQNKAIYCEGRREGLKVEWREEGREQSREGGRVCMYSLILRLVTLFIRGETPFALHKL